LLARARWRGPGHDRQLRCPGQRAALRPAISDKPYRRWNIRGLRRRHLRGIQWWRSRVVNTRRPFRRLGRESRRTVRDLECGPFVRAWLDLRSDPHLW